MKMGNRCESNCESYKGQFADFTKHSGEKLVFIKTVGSFFLTYLNGKWVVHRSKLTTV